MPSILSAIVASFGLSQICLTLVLIFRKNTGVAEKLFAFLLICTATYFFKPLIDFDSPNWLAWIWGAITTFVPGTFWLVCAAIFDDQFKLKPWHLLLVGITVVFPFCYRLYSFNYGESQTVFLLLNQAPQLLEFVLISLGLIQISRSWRNDLVEKRRSFRVLIMGFAGTMIFSVIFAQQVLPIKDGLIDMVHLPLLGLFLLLINIQLLEWDPSNTLFLVKTGPEQQRPPNEPPLKLTNPHLDRLRVLMEDEYLYKESHMSIGSLSMHLQLPEYKLRKLINKELAFRNFNDFLNTYRVRDACTQLKRGDSPITTIALDVGFKSLSSFNKAFKESLQMTPSEYRKSKHSNF